MIWSTIPYTEQNTLKLVILGHFLPFYSSKNPKNQNFDKWKNFLEISSFYTRAPKITILWCTFWDTEWDRPNFGHIMYGSWDMECNGQHFLSFWTIFCLSNPPNNLKNQNFEKMNKLPGDITILHRCNTNDDHMM